MNTFLYLSIIASAVMATPSVMNVKKYAKNDIRILDDLYSVGFWDVSFNESLYVYEAFGSLACFQNRSCRPNNLPCDPCDWTDPDVCSGVIRGPDSQCPCGTPPMMCDRTKYIYDYSIWPKGDPWATIEAKNGIADLFFHPPLPPNNCSCIIVQYEILEGSSQGILLYYGESWYYTNGEYVISQFGTATLCPSDKYWGQSLILRIIADSTKSGYVKYNVSVAYKDIPPIRPSGCVVPTDLMATHQCLPTGVLSRMSPLPGLTYSRFIVNPGPGERCGAMTFWGSTTDHFISTNPWVSPENSTGAFLVSRWSSPDGRPWPSVYSFCLEDDQSLYIFVLSAATGDYLVDTAKDWLILRPITDFPPPDFYRRLLTAVTAVCPGRNYTANQAFYTAVENMDSGSVNLRAVYPSDDLDVFFPPPPTAAEYYYKIRNIPTRPASPNRIVVSLVLNQRLLKRNQPLTWTLPWFQNDYQWLTNEEWKECTLIINEKISGADGVGLKYHIKTADEGLPRCFPDLYAEASTEIDKIRRIGSESTTQAYTLWFLQDRIASSNAIYSCKAELNSYYSRVQIGSKHVATDRCTSKFGSPEFVNDSCCHIEDTTLYSGCNIKHRNITDQFAISEYTANLLNCSTKECVQKSLTNLVLQYNLEGDPTACANSVERPADQNIYWKCIRKFWGEEPVTHAGMSCDHDVDCPNSLCNVYSHRCLSNVSVIEPLLISCIYDNATQFTRTYISNNFDLDPNDPNIKDMWLQKFSTILQCSDPHIPVGFDVNQVVYARCPGCTITNPNSTLLTVWAVSPGPSFPNFGHDCWAPGSASCSRSIAPVTAKTYCAIQGCNHLPVSDRGQFPFIAPASECSNKTFCGVTDDNFFYNDVTHVIPLHNCGSVLCILANGTLISTPDSVTCESIYTCDGKNALDATSEAQCIKGGSCSDASDYDVGIWKGMHQSLSGGCFFKIRYRNPLNPTSSICEAPMRNTILGCAFYQVNKTSCLNGDFSWGDRSIFQLINPRWISPAKTQDECFNYGKVCNDPDHPLPAGVPTYTNTYVFNDDCSKSQELFKWRPGRWLPGQVRSTTVVTGKLSQRFSNETRLGLNLPTVLGNLTKAADVLQSFKIRSTAFCRGVYKKFLDELICSCLTSFNDSFCYAEKQNITGISVACDEHGTIAVGDFKIKFINTSLPPATCDNLYVSTSSIVEYQIRSILPLRTLLVNYQEDSEFSVRNDKLGIYGKVLTNGYSTIFQTVIENVTICMNPSPLRGDYTSTTYSILDIAKRKNKNLPDDLNPMNLNVFVENGALCANLSSLEPGVIYYFIQRLDGDFAAITRRVFSDGVIVYIALELSLYCLGLVLSMGKLMYLWYGGWIDDDLFSYAKIRLSVVLILVSTFFLFRVILFSLLLNQGLLGSASSRAISYLLFEFPIVLYFSFVVNYICIWLTAITYIKDINVDFQRKINVANYISVAFAVLIFLIFVVIIIMFETIIFEPYFICGGSVLLYDAADSRSLLLAYRITFSSISVFVGCLLFSTAIKYNHLLRKLSVKMSLGVEIRLYVISIVGGLALVGQAIYFLIITVTDTTPDNYLSLSLLLILEIIPATFFIFVEQIGKPKKSSSSGVFQRRSTNPKNTPR